MACFFVDWCATGIYVTERIATRQSSSWAPALTGEATALALLMLFVTTICGCNWSRGTVPAVPSEIARCRQLTEQGALAMQDGEIAAAQAQFRSALLANPADIDARRLFAEALWARGQTTAAIAQMGAASQLAPHDAALTVRTGEMALAIGNLVEARAHAERAIADNPRFGPAWGLRGRVNWEAGRPREAVADLQRALVHTPGDHGILLSLSGLYLQQGEPRRALTTLHRLLDLHPPGTEPQAALFMEGQAYLALGRAADAADSLYAAADRGTSHAEIYYFLAKAESERGRTQAATRAAHLALATDSAHQESLRLLAQLSNKGNAGSQLLRR